MVARITTESVRCSRFCSIGRVRSLTTGELCFTTALHPASAGIPLSPFLLPLYCVVCQPQTHGRIECEGIGVLLSIPLPREGSVRFVRDARTIFTLSVRKRENRSAREQLESKNHSASRMERFSEKKKEFPTNAQLDWRCRELNSSVPPCSSTQRSFTSLLQWDASRSRMVARTTTDSNSVCCSRFRSMGMVHSFVTHELRVPTALHPAPAGIPVSPSFPSLLRRCLSCARMVARNVPNSVSFFRFGEGPFVGDARTRFAAAPIPHVRREDMSAPERVGVGENIIQKKK